MVNRMCLLFVLVGVPAIHSAVPDSTRGKLSRDADAAVRQLYWLHTKAVDGYVQRFCPDRASADDIVQETFIRAWRHLPRLSADNRQLVCASLQHLSPAYQTVLAEAFYRGGTPATVGRQVGIPPGTASSRLHYAVEALRQQLQEQHAAAFR
jgi:RNA polymerase sigma-70 factor, ECF subfamily